MSLEHLIIIVLVLVIVYLLYKDNNNQAKSLYVDSLAVVKGILKPLIEKLNKQYEVVFFSIDDFDKLEDTYGHYISEEVLRYLNNKLKVTFKSNKDYIAKTIGATYIVFVEKSEVKNRGILVDRINKIRKEISQNVFEVQHNKVVFTLSIGACFYNEKYLTIESQIDRARIALEKAKKTKNKLIISDKDFMREK